MRQFGLIDPVNFSVNLILAVLTVAAE